MGPSVTMSARVVAILWRHGEVQGLRERNRGKDQELETVLEDMRVVAAAHARSRVNATLASVDPAGPVSSEVGMTVGDTARVLGSSTSWVTKLVRQGRLRAERVGRQYLIDRADLADYIDRRHSDE